MEAGGPGQLQAAQAGRCRAEGQCWSPGRGEGAAQDLGCQRMGTLAANTSRTGMLGRSSIFWFSLGNTSGTGFTGPQVYCTPHCLFPFLELFCVGWSQH